MRNVEILSSWNFCREGQKETLVTVPHDWAAAGPFDRTIDRQFLEVVQDHEQGETEHNGRTAGLPHIGKGIYRCTIHGLSAPERRVYLEFEGVMSHAQVFINDHLAGGCNYGYTTFRVDATDFLHSGSNELKVTAENYPQSSRWYPGAGIYRKVRRIETDPVHFRFCSLHLRYLAEKNQLRMEGFVENHTGSSVSGVLEISSGIFETQNIPLSVNPDGTGFELNVPLLPHRRWSIQTPQLYDVKFLLRGENFCDTEYVRTGIRTIEFHPERGFLLNGKRTKINGVCLHHDLGPLGAAFNRAAARRQLEIMKEMGCNAIRTSHNPPAPEFLELCDEMGFLVMDEAFDMWHSCKLPNDYSLHFDGDSEKDLTALIQRDWNHPCVILWSIGNELSEIRDRKLNGAAIAKRLAAIVKSIDTERPVTAGFDCCEKAIENGLAAEVDIPAWNYRPWKYAEFHRLFPHCPVLGSETLSTVSSRGVYYFPAAEYVYDRRSPRPEAAELQCSSYCLDTRSFSSTPEAEFIAQEQGDFVAGQFIWIGFDYLGEPSPYNAQWPARSSYFGCVDLAGLPKDLFYLVQSQWKKHEAPMIHIVPHHWNWSEGQLMDIHVFSNCDEVELLLNDRSLGKIAPLAVSGVLPERYRFIFHDIAYHAGCLQAVGFRQGVRCIEETLKTAGKAAKLKLETKRNCCAADGEDMIFVTVSMTDSDGVLVPRAGHLVKFTIEGESLVIAAADAGNAASLEPFPMPECSLFSGMAVVYLKSTQKAGHSILRAETTGITPAEIVLHTLKQENNV